MGDIITVESCIELCDVAYDYQDIDRSSLVFCYPERLVDFFKVCQNHPECNYIVVSAASDYGICYQKDNHPNRDLPKLIDRILWEKVLPVTDKYMGLSISSVKDKRCSPQDTYSVKMDSMTDSTFEKLPDNLLHLFTVNLNCWLEKSTFLPFGINHSLESQDILDKFKGRKKDKLLYINFSPNNHQRLKLVPFYQNKDWVTVSSGLHVEQFYDEMSRHKFVLCPFGNGYDCYRTYEALALGCVPIVNASIFSQHLWDHQIPGIGMPNLFNITKEFLERIEIPSEFNLESIKHSTWTKKIKDYSEKLLCKSLFVREE